MDRWVKASCTAGTCVEVLETETTVYIRNSNRPENVLGFTKEEWTEFIAGVNNREFDFK